MINAQQISDINRFYLGNNLINQNFLCGCIISGLEL